VIILVEEILAAMRRFYRAGFAAFLVIVIATAVVICFYPRKYQSRGKLLIRLGREQMVPDATASHSVSLMQLHRTSEHEMNTAVAEMSSRAILELVVNDAGATAILKGRSAEDAGETSAIKKAISDIVSSLTPSIDPISDHEKAIILLEKQLKIEAPKDSSVVSIRFVTKTPTLANRVVSSWVTRYIESHVQLANDDLVLDFLTEQATLLNHQLATARGRLQNQKDLSRLVSVNGQQQLLESRLQNAADRRDTIEGEWVAVRQRAEKLQRLLTAIHEEVIVSQTSGLGDSAYDGITQIVFELESAQKGVASTMKEGHPRRVAIDTQLDDLKKILDTLESQRKTSVSARNPIYLELERKLLLDEAEAVALEHKLAFAKDAHETIVAQIEKLNGDEGQIAELTREIVLLEKLCSEQASRVEQARFDRALQLSKISSIRVIQPPTLEEQPVSPRTVLVALLGGISAMCAGIGLPFFLFDRQRTLRRAETRFERSNLSSAAPAWNDEWADSQDVISGKSTLAR